MKTTEMLERLIADTEKLAAQLLIESSMFAEELQAIAAELQWIYRDLTEYE